MGVVQRERDAQQRRQQDLEAGRVDIGKAARSIGTDPSAKVPDSGYALERRKAETLEIR